MKEDINYENDISAQEEAARQGPRIQVQNEHPRRKKGPSRQKSKEQKGIVRLKKKKKKPQQCGFFVMFRVIGNGISEEKR